MRTMTLDLSLITTDLQPGENIPYTAFSNSELMCPLFGGSTVCMHTHSLIHVCTAIAVDLRPPLVCIILCSIYM